VNLLGDSGMKFIKYILLNVVLLLLSLLMIVPVVSAGLVNTPEGVIITHYPEKFDGIGTISRIERKGIVVDDMFLSFASHVRYMTPQSEYSHLGSFKSGQKVGYMLNDSHQITILCLFISPSKADLAN